MLSSPKELFEDLWRRYRGELYATPCRSYHSCFWWLRVQRDQSAAPDMQRHTLPCRLWMEGEPSRSTSGTELKRLVFSDLFPALESLGVSIWWLGFQVGGKFHLILWVQKFRTTVWLRETRQTLSGLDAMDGMRAALWGWRDEATIAE